VWTSEKFPASVPKIGIQDISVRQDREALGHSDRLREGEYVELIEGPALTEQNSPYS